ncbi:hypothetical protein AB0L63_12240 [Nocardia sp. NPDC051990]
MGRPGAKSRVHNLAISLDGHIAGPNRLESPLGEGGMRLHN